MTSRRTARRLVRWYPPAWRARYGEELAELIVAMAGAGGIPWRDRADVARAGVRARLAPAGGAAPEQRARRGVITVLWSWAVFVIAGAIVRKASEHWGGAALGVHPVAGVAFDVLVAAGVAGALLALVGVALAVPGLVALMRAGGWPRIRGPVVRAVALTVVAVAATAALVVWAHGLSGAQRDGHDPTYVAGFIAWAVLCFGGLLAWVAAAARIAAALHLGRAVVRAHVWLACAVTAAMTVATVATLTWWIAVALRAPGALVDASPGAHPSPIVSQLVVAAVAMAAAVGVGGLGARRAVIAARIA